MKGNTEHGYWDEDTDKDRCILRCYGGYEPSGCHVIRYNSWTEKWNRDIPSCQKGKGISKSHVNTPSTPLSPPRVSVHNIDTKEQKSNSLTDITHSITVGFQANSTFYNSFKMRFKVTNY